MNNLHDQDDTRLLTQIAAQDARSFALLYDRYSKAAYGLAYRILQNPRDAEDVVQDAFLTIWQRHDTYGIERGSVRSWLLSIVHHRAIDRVRRRAYREDAQDSLEEGILLSEANDVSEQVCQSMESEQLRAALHTLPIDQQRSVVMAYFGGYTHDQIAEQLHLPLGTVKGRLRLALQKLRTVVQQPASTVPVTASVDTKQRPTSSAKAKETIRSTTKPSPLLRHLSTVLANSQ